MSWNIADRVQETASNPGTGTFTFLGAVTGYRTFSAAVSAGDFADGSTVQYAASDGTGWEVGQGGPYELLARSLTAGFSHQILANRGRVFEGVGDERFYAHPGSVLYAQPPRFAVATELVVSNRAYARQLSPVRPS